MVKISVGQLYDYNRGRLNLSWICGHREAQIAAPDGPHFAADLVGHLNLIHAARLQVFGSAEIQWWQAQPIDATRRYLQQMLSGAPPAFIVADGMDPPPLVRYACEREQVPLMASAKSSSAVVDQLRSYLGRVLAPKQSLHGVFMDVLGMGALVTGDSGVGKSELALELISRGHGLVADDIVEVARIAPNVLEGSCPPLLKDFLEVRGLGILNIRTVFGESACRRRMRLRLVIHLHKAQPGMPEATRLPLDAESHQILGVEVRRVIIPVAAGRNLAVLAEAAVRTTILQLRGIDTTLEFVERQQQALGDQDTMH